MTIETGYRRIYPYAPLAAHVVGYMGAITAEDARPTTRTSATTRPTAASRSGGPASSCQYEHELHGTVGQRSCTRSTPHGNIVREISRTEPVDGQDSSCRSTSTSSSTPSGCSRPSCASSATWHRRPTRSSRSPTAAASACRSTHGHRRALRGAGRFGGRDEQRHRPGRSRWRATRRSTTAGSSPASAATSSTSCSRPHRTPGAATASDPRDDPDQAVLTNRAIQGQYNLGSTFKPFVAWAGIRCRADRRAALLRRRRHLRGPRHRRPTVRDRASSAPGATRRAATACRACTAASIVAGGAGGVERRVLLLARRAVLRRCRGPSTSCCRTCRPVRLRRRHRRRPAVRVRTGGSRRNENKADLVERGVLRRRREHRVCSSATSSTCRSARACSPRRRCSSPSRYSALANGGYRMVPRVVKAIYAAEHPAGLPPERRATSTSAGRSSSSR